MVQHQACEFDAVHPGRVVKGALCCGTPRRSHTLENRVFDSGCDALGGLERAQLMQGAVLFETFRLGIRFSDSIPPPLKKPWPYLPDRSWEATDVRVSISMR